MNRLKNRLSRILKGYWARMPPAAWRQLLISMIPYVLIGYIAHKLSWLYSCCAGANLFSRLSVLLNNVPLAFGRPIMSFRAQDMLTGLAAAVMTRLCVALKGKNKRKYRTGSEYGSARWGTSRDIAPFIDPVYENNILLTATERLTMNGRPALPKYARNKNVMIVGGSGSGKTRFYVKPNLMQMPDKVSYVVTDPKGQNLVSCPCAGRL